MQKAFWQFGNLYTGKELVMGLPNSVIFAQGSWQGCLLHKEHSCDLVSLLEEHADWMPRDEAEKDASWQQVIPFGVFRCGDLYAELKRGTDGSHTSLYKKYTLGVGGHVIKSEFERFESSLTKWMEAKFHEEMDYEGELHTECIGLVNDHFDSLGKHHLGIVFLLEGNLAEFKAKKHMESRMVRLGEMTGEDVNYLDRWSQMIYRQIVEKGQEFGCY